MIAPSAEAAKKRKQRPASDRVVSSRALKPGEGAGTGPKSKRWSRIRPDGKGPDASAHQGRGLGPAPKKRR